MPFPMNKTKNKYGAYLIDLDGTMYRGDEHIDGASEFVQALNMQHIPYLFLTNNSAKTPEQVADKLMNMNILATPDNVFTTSMATAVFVRKKKEHARCFVIGEEGLFSALKEEGLVVAEDDVDFVLVGIDRDITYEKLAKATLAVQNGATLISTNRDVAIPTERGLVPGNGALTSVISVSTGIDPIFIGKPATIMMEEAQKIIGYSKDKLIMVGDNYDTDIQAGIQAGIDTLMTFTGVTPFNQYEQLPVKPTHYVHNLREWI